MSGSEPAHTISRLRDLLSEVASEALEALQRGQRSYAIRLLKVLNRPTREFSTVDKESMFSTFENQPGSREVKGQAKGDPVTNPLQEVRE